MVQAKSNPLVEPQWLRTHLDDPGIVILDTSVRKPVGREVPEQIKNLQIPGSRYFDLDGKFSMQGTDLPHMMPDTDHFNREAQVLGLSNKNLIVLYDNVGVYSSPRVWWMFKAMGHENVVVLNGGLPEWIQLGLPIEEKQNRQTDPGDFKGELNPDYFLSAYDVLKIHGHSDHQIYDARSEGRFYAREPEPRPGLRGGHIPSSKCLPFPVLQDGYRMKDANEQKKVFREMGSEDHRLVFSCGSGLTACILALGAYQAGFRNLSVYDGSWSEWGGNVDLPVET